MNYRLIVERTLQDLEIPNCTPLSYPDFQNKVLGTIFGNALGDALGLRTEFYSEAQSKLLWKDDEFRLTNWPDQGRGFPEGDWTDDTDQMILILESFLTSSELSPEDFAKRLLFWIRNGFPELGDTCGMGLGALVSSVAFSSKFLDQPQDAALDRWTASNFAAAPNGALMRTSVLGVIHYDDLAEVIFQTVNIATVTHADPRSVASCVALTAMISLMLQGHPYQEAYELAIVLAKRFILEYLNEIEKDVILSAKEEKIKIFEAVKENFSQSQLEYYLRVELDDLGSIDTNTMGFTYTCLACGFWGSRQDDWVVALRKIVLKGGDADTNGAVAGAGLGCKLGLDALPGHLVTGMKHYSWLKEKADRLLEKIRPADPSLINP